MLVRQYPVQKAEEEGVGQCFRGVDQKEVSILSTLPDWVRQSDGQRRGEGATHVRSARVQYMRWRDSHPAKVSVTTPITVIGQNCFKSNENGVPSRKTPRRTTMK
jgi:hypothetical protein